MPSFDVEMKVTEMGGVVYQGSFTALEEEDGVVVA